MRRTCGLHHFTAVIFAFSFISQYAWADESQSPDLVIVNAKIVTLEQSQPEAQALAVLKGRILAVGGNDSIRRKIGANTRVIDAEGRLLLPGFNDSHVHFVSGGKQLSSVQLRDAKSKDEFVKRIADFAATQSPGSWITGGDWDHENWVGSELPSRQWIDEVTRKHPVLVSRLDGHMALANSLALELAGITRDSTDRPGGLIVRANLTREPTGILKDAAMNAVLEKIPASSMEERTRSALAATEHAASLGVTSVQDMSGDSDVLVYRELQRQGKLKTRIYAMAPLPQWQKSADRGFKAASGDAWIRQGGLKGFADGSLGSTTAYFFEPYLDDPRTNGLPSDEMVSEGTMRQRVSAADFTGLQIMIHAIGDRANSQVLSIFESVAKENGPRDRRFRIEHAQHLRAVDIPRFGSSHVIASMQPFHCADDGRWAEKRIGPQRAQGTYAFRSLIDSGAKLAFGSDWNVAPLNPMRGIAAAVTRRTLDGLHQEGWVPQQKISVLEAITAYTLGSAYAEFTEKEKGSLSIGNLADFTLLSQDIFAIPIDQIENTRVLLTVIDGRIVYDVR